VRGDPAGEAADLVQDRVDVRYRGEQRGERGDLVVEEEPHGRAGRLHQRGEPVTDQVADAVPARDELGDQGEAGIDVAGRGAAGHDHHALEG
jgi:hypothetical protein